MADFIFLDSKIAVDRGYSHEIERYLLRRKATTNLDNVLKSRDIILLTKVFIVKAIIFPVVMYGLDHKEGQVPKNLCFQTVVLEKTLESPWNSEEIKLVNIKENLSEYLLEGLMLKLQYSGHLRQRADSLEKTMILGNIVGRRRRG